MINRKVDLVDKISRLIDLTINDLVKDAVDNSEEDSLDSKIKEFSQSMKYQLDSYFSDLKSIEDLPLSTLKIQLEAKYDILFDMKREFDSVFIGDVN